jgi:hypothetical protein
MEYLIGQRQYFCCKFVLISASGKKVSSHGIENLDALSFGENLTSKYDHVVTNSNDHCIPKKVPRMRHCWHVLAMGRYRKSIPVAGYYSQVPSYARK